MRISAFILRRFRLLRGDRSGAALVEFAIVSTLLIALMLPLVDIGMGFYVKTQVMTAAQAGVQYAYLHGWDTDSQHVQTDICTAVKQGSGLGNSNNCTGAADPNCDNTGSDALLCSAKPTVNDTTLSTAAPNIQLSCYCSDGTTFNAPTTTLTSPWTVSQCTSLAASNCTGSNNPVSPGAYVTVRARYVYKPLIPYTGFSFVWGPGTGSGITLQSQATMRIQ